MNRDHLVTSETVPKYCISDSFIDYGGFSISPKGFLLTVINIMEKKIIEFPSFFIFFFNLIRNAIISFVFEYLHILLEYHVANQMKCG